MLYHWINYNYDCYHWTNKLTVFKGWLLHVITPMWHIKYYGMMLDFWGTTNPILRVPSPDLTLADRCWAGEMLTDSGAHRMRPNIITWPDEYHWYLALKINFYQLPEIVTYLVLTLSAWPVDDSSQFPRMDRARGMWKIVKVAGGPVVGSLVSGNINPRQVVTHDKTIIRTFKNNFALKLESSSSFLTLPTLKSYTYIHVTFACIWPRLWPKTNDPTIGPFPSKNAEPFLP